MVKTLAKDDVAFRPNIKGTIEGHETAFPHYIPHDDETLVSPPDDSSGKTAVWNVNEYLPILNIYNHIENQDVP